MTDDWTPDRRDRDEWGEPIGPPRPRRRPEGQPPRRRPDPRQSGGTGNPAADPRRPADSRRQPPADPRRQPPVDPRRRAPVDPRLPADPRRPGAGDPRRQPPAAAPPPRQRPPEQGRPVRRPQDAGQPRRQPAPAAPVRRPAPVIDGYYEDQYASTGGYAVGGYDDGYDDGLGYAGYDDDWVDHERSRGWLFLLVGLVVVALVCVGGYVALGDQIKELITGSSAPDYAGGGNGEEVLITIIEGDTGADVARTLHDEGVTKSFQAFYDLLLAQNNDVTFVPGVYSLQGEMSAQAALDAFRDPTTRVTNRIVIREGLSVEDTFTLLSDATGIPVAEFEAAAADHAALGVPAEAPSIEGFLFPATYELEPDSTADGLVKMMVDQMISRLDNAGVAPEDRFRIVTLASIIQREAGSVDADFYKVSRVFHNRLEAGWKLESDATVSYGRGHYDSVFTTAEERADTSNPYNTYANEGLPVGPIGMPGELAIDAAANPVDGPWFYFVTVNLATGETKFSESLEEHNAGVQQLRDWCAASEENNEYCS